MSARARLWFTTLVVVTVGALGLLVPAVAAAHAYLISTSPTASGVLNSPPKMISLTFDEAVEPRFAIISVTNVSGREETTGPVARSPANPDTLVVPVRHGLPQGWYLIYWRAISVDGHPVQGAFTYAVGPNPGPAPQFRVPSISATAVTPQLLIARWITFLSVMVAVGLLALRLLIARVAVRRAPGTSLHAVSVAFVIASLVGLIAIPVYLDFAIANDSLRSVFDLGALVPLYRVTAFGRGYVDLEVCFALFCVAGWIALWVDRPERPRRSVAELAATTGAALGAVGVLFIPSAVGHAGQTSPRGLSVAFDGLHLISGSLWLGGLVGLLVLWFGVGRERRVPALSLVVPRFSAVALVSVLVLLGTGTGATIIHMPAVNALWQTSYGVAILVKIGLLAVAVALASGNLLRSKPRLVGRPHPARAGRARRPAPAPPDQRRGDHRHRGRVRGRGAVEPGPATAGLRPAELGPGPGRSGPGGSHRQPRRLPTPGAGLAQQGGGAGLVRAAHHQGRGAGPGRHGDAALQPPRDADAPAGILAARDPPGALLAGGTGADHGRQMGPVLPGRPPRRAAVHGVDRRPG